MEQQVAQFLGIGIVGTFLSVALQVIKNHWGTETNTTKAITIGLSILLGAFIWFFQGTPLYISVLGVLSSASAVYALVLKQ